MIRNRGHWHFGKISADVWIGSGMGSPGKGDNFWVDGVNGSATASGKSPDSPLSTIAAAMALCESGRDDYIWVMDCWAQDTFPVVLAKQQLHILGISLPSYQYAKMNPSNDAEVFSLTSAGAYSEIAGFALSGGDNHGCIDIDGTEGSFIHDCTFGGPGAGGTPKHGILITQNPEGSRIEDCLFLGDLGSHYGLITENGIECNASINMVRGLQVLNNRFIGLSIGINMDNADYWWVEGNRFIVTNRANGEAITVAADCLDSSFIENRAAYGMVNGGYSYNPYKDLAANTVNNWAMNYMGNSVVEPVGA